MLFLIDVSHQAVATGFSDAVIQSVRQCIADIQYLKTRIGIAMYFPHMLHAAFLEIIVWFRCFIFRCMSLLVGIVGNEMTCRYDRHVYFFDVRGESPKMLVMSNFEEPFNVMSSSVVMTLETNRDKLNAVLDLIPKVGLLHDSARLCPPRISPQSLGTYRSVPILCAHPLPWVLPSSLREKLLPLQCASLMPPAVQCIVDIYA